MAKNYLRHDEIAELDRIVVMYLDYAEDQARRRRTLYMRDWRERLDAFLQFNERDVLADAGRVSKAVADRLALDQFEQFNARRLAAEDAAELAGRVARGEARLFRLGVYIAVRACSVAELADRVTEVRAMAASLLLDLAEVTWRHLQGWITTLPLAFDAWRIAVVFSILSAVLTLHRIRVEEAALQPRR